MDTILAKIFQKLQKLVGLHRELLEAVRAEREALVQADLNRIHAATSIKQALIESIHQVEFERLKSVAELAEAWGVTQQDLTLPNMIIQIQGSDIKAADQFRTMLNTLTILIQRISEQNDDNKALIEKSLEHLYVMKKNILGESSSYSSTYSHQGQKMHNSNGPRIISKEA